MPDFPAVGLEPPIQGILSSLGDVFIGAAAHKFHGGNAVSTVWGGIRKVLYIPVVVTQPVTINRMAWVNGAAVSGNVAVGIYDVAGNKLTDSASTLQATINVVQVATVTAITLMPDLYYLALGCDNITATFMTVPGVTAHLRTCGVQTQTLGTWGAPPLPATATFAAMDSNPLPALVAAYDTTF